MFKLFKRLVQGPKPAANKRARVRDASSLVQDTEPAALPEVIEGDGEADWNLWQDSVASDSRLQPISALQESEFAQSSAFDKIRKGDA
ncbi:MAG: hypothetical protein ABIU58_05300 [Ramlibacter sp.]